MSQNVQLSDSFNKNSGGGTLVAGTDLTQSKPATGLAWQNSSGSLKVAGDGGVYAGTNGVDSVYINPTVPSSNNQFFSFDWKVGTDPGGTIYPAFKFRVSNANSDFYYVGFSGNLNSNGLYYNVGKHQGGSYSNPAFSATQVDAGSFGGNLPAWGAGFTFHVRVSCVTVGSTVVIKIYLFTTQYSWVELTDWTDSAPSASLLANNLVGITLNSPGDSATAGLHFANLQAVDWNVNGYFPGDAALANIYQPLQWWIDSVNPSYVKAVAFTCGAEINLTFTGTSISMVVNNQTWLSQAGAQAHPPVYTYSIDNGPQVIVATTLQTFFLFQVGGLAAGTHTLKLTYCGYDPTSSPINDRWTNYGDGPLSVARLGGYSTDGFLLVDAGATVSAALPFSKHMLILGDSISESDYSNLGLGVGLVSDPRTDYSYQLGEELGLNTFRITYAGSGYTKTATDNVPPVGTHWKYFCNTPSGLAPRNLSSVAANVAAVVILHGVNDLSSTSAATQAAAQALYADLLTTLPNALILVYVPFGQACIGAITAAVNATNSPRVKLRNLGSRFAAGLGNLGSPTYQSSDGTHPNTMTHSQLKGGMAADIANAIAIPAASSFVF